MHSLGLYTVYIIVLALEELSLEIARWLDDPVMENKMIMRNSIKVNTKLL